MNEKNLYVVSGLSKITADSHICKCVCGDCMYFLNKDKMYDYLNPKKYNIVLRITMPKDLNLWLVDTEECMPIKDYKPLIMICSGYELTSNVELTKLWVEGEENIEKYLTKKQIEPIVNEAAETFGRTIAEYFSRYNVEEIFQEGIELWDNRLQIRVRNWNDKILECDGKKYAEAMFWNNRTGCRKEFFINEENPGETLKEICAWFEEQRLNFIISLIHMS